MGCRAQNLPGGVASTPPHVRARVKTAELRNAVFLDIYISPHGVLEYPHRTARANTLNLRATYHHDTLNQKMAPVTPPYVPEVISGHETYPIAF